MSYEVDEDGVVTFRCNGCGKEKGTRRLKSLPSGWCVVGILQTAVDPEWEEGTPAPQNIGEIGLLLGAHFHSAACGKRYLTSVKVTAMVSRARVALALYSRAEIVIDGTEGEIPAPGRSLDHDNAAEGFHLGSGEGPAV